MVHTATARSLPGDSTARGLGLVHQALSKLPFTCSGIKGTLVASKILHEEDGCSFLGHPDERAKACSCMQTERVSGVRRSAN